MRLLINRYSYCFIISLVINIQICLVADSKYGNCQSMYLSLYNNPSAKTDVSDGAGLAKFQMELQLLEAGDIS